LYRRERLSYRYTNEEDGNALRRYWTRRIDGSTAPLFSPIAKAMRVASLRAPPESSLKINSQA